MVVDAPDLDHCAVLKERPGRKLALDDLDALVAANAHRCGDSSSLSSSPLVVSRESEVLPEQKEARQDPFDVDHERVEREPSEFESDPAIVVRVRRSLSFSFTFLAVSWRLESTADRWRARTRAELSLSTRRGRRLQRQTSVRVARSCELDPDVPHASAAISERFDRPLLLLDRVERQCAAVPVARVDVEIRSVHQHLDARDRDVEHAQEVGREVPRRRVEWQWNVQSHQCVGRRSVYCIIVLIERECESEGEREHRNDVETCVN